MIQVRNATNTPVMVTRVEVRNAAGVAVPVKVIEVRDADGAAKVVFQQMTAAASPQVVNGGQSSPSTINIVTNATTATPTGGVGPYTYLWTRTDAGPGSWTITSPTTAETAFRGNSVASGADLTATFKCTVTDAGGTVAVTGDVIATVVNYNYS